ncbi:uncharacterized protein [Lepeophtheirus salmonis]|uniref:Insulin-like domain-containing protein n=1 Tax=Lepeophtheirus salmonis TaxID=72036 RepID=A0A0K2UBV1_LEPSM|nr:insulin-related peptide 1-like [Lepeophtheirus salmonis]XP_040565569.1 insulin-related peptide 1-like [Lepeophtheirus salmonis]XP_040565570.1 insulin-related peptide 1-like [Lepeophtheirus salmonis]XP_040565572.1 insulin-related peptide 1-like [Lepeophtheirus salmonis]XP_040565574.1 insulin-related peptide 1-like [Lepeophtheirus salmonis]
MSKSCYILSFIFILLSTNLGVFSLSEFEENEEEDQTNNLTENKDDKVTEESAMVLCGHNLYSALRVACSSIRSKRSAEAFRNHHHKRHHHRLVKRAGLTDLCCSQPCTFQTLLTFC